MQAKITIPEPQWGGSLTSLILELEKIRTKQLFSTVPPGIFFQLKEIFQTLETLGSARIVKLGDAKQTIDANSELKDIKGITDTDIDILNKEDEKLANELLAN